MIATAPAIQAKVNHPIACTTWGDEETAAAYECLKSRQTTMGAKVRQFEEEFSRYLAWVSESVMVNSGSSADLVMMMATRELGYLKPGDEILIPAVTWPTQVWAAMEAGFNVRLVDVDVNTLNTSPAILEAAITPKTKAIFLVHLLGSPCDMDGILELAARKNLLIFEDCCEALGAKFDFRHTGTFGLASAFSFFQSHHITTMEGGMISTSDPKFADMCRMIRAHGWARDLRNVAEPETMKGYVGVDDTRYLFMAKGFNFRPSELNGAFGLCQLPKLDDFNRNRNRNALSVHDRFRVTNSTTVQPLTPTHHKSQPAWFALPFVLQDGLPYSRKDVTDYLEKFGVETRPIVGGNLARHPAFLKYPNMPASILPGANAIHDRGFYVGLPPIEFDTWPLAGLLNGMDSFLRAG